jgi:predicted nucleic acid-binding protein
VKFAHFDTSALVKRYVRERGSAQVGSLLGQYDFLSSAITSVEIWSAFCRRKRSGDLSEEEFSAVSSRIQNDRIRWELIEVGVSVLDRAEEIIQGAVPMRALDAIHVASLMSFQAASSVQVPFVTGDARQREAANQFGLDVIWVV